MFTNVINQDRSELFAVIGIAATYVGLACALLTAYLAA